MSVDNAWFEALGDAIARRWRERSWDEEQLPAIAEEALSAAPQLTASPAAILEWACLTERLPRQQDPRSTFGQPPLTLYSHERFVIDVYYWFESTTMIHQHAFHGLFRVLAGSSVHTTYRFTRERRVEDDFLLGKIEVVGSELLRTGDQHRIVGGARFVHSLFHLEQPSVSLVIRTVLDSAILPQYSYDRPFIALNTFRDLPSETRMREALRALHRFDEARYAEVLRSVVAGADLLRTYVALGQHLALHDGEDELRQDRTRELFAIARGRHGADVDLLAACLAENARQREITKMRVEATDPELRFFLALLLVCSGRDEVLQLVRRRFPADDAPARVVGWLRALAALPSRRFGGGSALGFELGEDVLVVLELVLRGVPPPELPAALVERGTFTAEEVEDQREEIVALPQQLKQHAVLRVLV